MASDPISPKRELIFFIFIIETSVSDAWVWHQPIVLAGMAQLMVQSGLSTGESKLESQMLRKVIEQSGSYTMFFMRIWTHQNKTSQLIDLGEPVYLHGLSPNYSNRANELELSTCTISSSKSAQCHFTKATSTITYQILTNQPCHYDTHHGSQILPCQFTTSSVTWATNWATPSILPMLQHDSIADSATCPFHIMPRKQATLAVHGFRATKNLPLHL